MSNCYKMITAITWIWFLLEVNGPERLTPGRITTLAVYTPLYIWVKDDIESLWAKLFVIQSVCLSFSQSVCHSVSLYVIQSVCLSFSQSVFPSVSLCVLQSIYLSFSQSVCHSKRTNIFLGAKLLHEPVIPSVSQFVTMCMVQIGSLQAG